MRPISPAMMPAPLTPKERRERNRREMIEVILAAARVVMQEHGVSALNLNEVARRVRLRPQSLAEYFPTKAALYDALFEQAVALFQAGDERAYGHYPPGWGQVEAWFANRVALADEHPDLHHLGFDAPVPDYLQSERVLEMTRGVLAGARKMVAAAIAAGAMDPGMEVDRATDLLLAIRHGLIAERLGKQPFVLPDADRFDDLVPDVIRMLRRAWAPASAASDGRQATSAIPPGATDDERSDAMTD
jgi:AcrR family transcriptional regulator